MTLKVLYRGAMSRFSGYGNDGIDLVRALMASGADVYLQPSHVDAPLPADVAQLLTKPLEAPFDLYLHHADPGSLGLEEHERKCAKVTVAWTMWEYSSFDNLKGKTRLAKTLSSYDLVLSYDQVCAEALAPHVQRKDSPVVAVLQGGFNAENWKPIKRDWNSERFGFCMVGQLHERKDPFVAIQAFQELKEEHPDEFEPAELHLKTNIPGLHPLLETTVPKLRIHYAVWPASLLKDFYAAQHVLLAPSRGEGKNLPALEFQATGGAVIATNWGGMSSWLSDQYAYPLDYVLREINAGVPNCLNARASKDHLKELMLHTFRNRDEVRRKGELASQVIPSTMDWQRVVERLFLKLGKALPQEQVGALTAKAHMMQPTEGWSRESDRGSAMPV